MNGDRTLSLYFHVPFCTKKCGYCHFFVLPDSPDAQASYLDALSTEWAVRKEQTADRPIYSIYFGGGTPSLLNPHAFETILAKIHYNPAIEITIEANPEQLTLEKLKAFRSLGINRISIGAQSFDDTLLQKLGRTHNAKETENAVIMAYEQGFENITIDLMYDLPGQDLQDWQKSLKIAASLPINHLSLYNLQIEEGTVFHKKRKQLEPLLPDPETSLQMLQMAKQEMSRAGLIQYEISAFAKPGKHSQHNTSYWTGREFIGFGPSAFSYLDGIRFRNPTHFGKYKNALAEGRDPADFFDELKGDARRRELLAIELRLLQGVDLQNFQKRHGALHQDTLAALLELEADNLITYAKDHPRLTEQGVLFYDTVASTLV